MENYLILQILGSSDVWADSEEGIKKLKNCYTFEDIQEAAKWNNEELINELERVDFPLIRQVRDSQPIDVKLHYGIILTNQVSWIKNKDIQGELWNDIITSDGYWWKDILSHWCKEHEINYYLIHLDISSDVDKGAADWEGMAKSVDTLLNGLFKFKQNSWIFKPASLPEIPIDKIIVQHSSGTPALSGALYLWGIEQKLVNPETIEFVYISKQDSISYPHSGKHWQWRLKVPQIKQLLAIQDFAGAHELLTAHLDTNLQETCKLLDRAVSFNIAGNTADPNSVLATSDEVIERISIALWSERAFREREQWMHWYLRVAGAFELALHCLVKQQGSGAYQWQKKGDKTVLEYTDSSTGTREPLNPNMGIKKIVCELLSNGSIRYGKVYNVTEVTDSRWNKFKEFYCDNKWELDEQNCTSFIYLRNDLYHSLLGDSIDKILDAKTAKLGTVNHPKHPSEVAVEQLRYIIQLAGLSSQVQQRVQHYEKMVEDIKGNL
jgi:hypothetical protein